ncbi:sarcosine oxidase [Lipingzhangella halophila]|uniref:Sarcosine oxidase n=1 Tax=Lipingzhangella halophila TaxID=1783352 RepID=A0A7W7RKC3_9ACTN|nr:FAD-dependent oxidoreductase [Lipingzhangella halophila]MBB4933412.1 sarcosine oxidase [Lipingzhangella halophila]
MAVDELPAEVDIAVVGAGLMGSAAAWAATRRGHSVALLEQFSLGHDHGSSHGSARIVRRAYADPLYVRMTGRAFALWRELERDSGQPLLRITGGLDHGEPWHTDGIAAALAEAGVPHELLAAEEAQRRWPGMRFEGRVVFHPEAGTVDAARAMDAFVACARRRGASVHPESPVQRVSIAGGRARVETGGGAVTAHRVVAACGAWTADLLAGLVPLPELTVTQQQVFHFPRRDFGADWPTAVHEGAAAHTYNLPGGRDGGPGDGRKLAEYLAPDGEPTAPGDRSGVVSPAARDRVTDYVREWLPGLAPTPFNEATCLYTSTSGADFVLDRTGPVVVCSPCSGHGAKFAPLIGEVAADLADGGQPPDPRFTLAAHSST